MWYQETWWPELWTIPAQWSLVGLGIGPKQTKARAREARILILYCSSEAVQDLESHNSWPHKPPIQHTCVNCIYTCFLPSGLELALLIDLPNEQWPVAKASGFPWTARQWCSTVDLIKSRIVSSTWLANGQWALNDYWRRPQIDNSSIIWTKNMQRALNVLPKKLWWLNSKLVRCAAQSFCGTSCKLVVCACAVSATAGVWWRSMSQLATNPAAAEPKLPPTYAYSDTLPQKYNLQKTEIVLVKQSLRESAKSCEGVHGLSLIEMWILFWQNFLLFLRLCGYNALACRLPEFSVAGPDSS